MVKKGLLAGITILIFGLLLNWAVGMVLPQISLEYQNIKMFRPFIDPLMMIYFAYPFILGLVAYYLWEKLKKPKAIEFAKTYFLIATIPGMFITYTSFQISLAMVLLWTLTGFVQAYIAGWIFSRKD
jgi:hypothetical protein